VLAAAPHAKRARGGVGGGGRAARPAADSVCALVPPGAAESLLAVGRFWHASRVATVPRGARPLPAENLLAAALAIEGLGQFDRVEELLQRGRSGDSLPAWVALAARADERAERWRDAERRYRALAELSAASPSTRAAAAARLAAVLEYSGRRDSAAAAWRRAAVALPEIADWFALRRAELTDDTTVAFAIVSGARSPGAIQRAELFVARARNDHLAALEVYQRLGRPLDIARAEYALGRVRAARARADSLLFRDTARPNGFLAAVFLTERFDSLTLREYLAVGRAYKAQRDPWTAERFFRRAIRAADTSVAAWLALAELQSERRLHGLALLSLDSANTRAGRGRAPLIGRARVAALIAADRSVEAEPLLRGLVQAHPGDTNVARAVLAAADRHRARNETAAERARYLTLIRRFPDAGATDAALFRLGLLLYTGGLPDSALALIVQAAARDSTGVLGAGPRYWRARIRMEQGDEEARAALRRLAQDAPFTFYGTRAREILGDSVLVVDTALALPRLGSFPPARARERVRLLAGLGFDADARAEAVGWADDTTTSVQVLLAVAGAAAEAGYARESIALGEVARRRAGLIPGVVRALFPYGYRRVIEAEAGEQCVDPLLLAAIIRQESRFDPRAVSPVGARGISQVMPPTGEQLAATLRLGRFDADLLFVPDFNLHLGARYLHDRITRDGFPTHAVFASYNAGPTRVTRWRAWPEFQDPDLFAERIPITETRDYVRTVYASYVWYRQVYSDPTSGTPLERPLAPLP